MPTVRRATQDDAERLRDVFACSIRELAKDHYDTIQIDSWSGGFTADQFREHIESGNVYVAECEGSTAGFVEVNLATDELEMVFVSPAYAARGVGAELVRFAERLAKEAGRASLHLRSSLNAVPFYEHMGYVVTERRIHCNARGVEFECTIMEKQLD